MSKTSHRLQKQRSEAMSYEEAMVKLNAGFAITLKTWGDQGFYIVKVTEARPVRGYEPGDIVRKWRYGRFYSFPMSMYVNSHNWLLYDETKDRPAYY